MVAFLNMSEWFTKSHVLMVAVLIAGVYVISNFIFWIRNGNRMQSLLRTIGISKMKHYEPNSKIWTYKNGCDEFITYTDEVDIRGFIIQNKTVMFSNEFLKKMQKTHRLFQWLLDHKFVSGIVVNYSNVGEKVTFTTERKNTVKVYVNLQLTEKGERALAANYALSLFLIILIDWIQSYGIGTLLAWMLT